MSPPRSGSASRTRTQNELEESEGGASAVERTRYGAYSWVVEVVVWLVGWAGKRKKRVRSLKSVSV